MTDKTDDAPAVNKFPIASIEKTDPPQGETGGEWYEYVIGIGSSSIRGKRIGTLEAVTEYVKEYAENLNQRSALGYSSYAARKVQKPATPAPSATPAPPAPPAKPTTT